MVRFLRNVVRSPFAQIVTGIFLMMMFGGWAIGKLEVSAIAEGNNPFWWAIVTMTTVGYGDYSPITPEGRLLAIVVMFAGISLTALLTATVSSIFVAKKIREDKGLESLNVSEHILLCGWNGLVDSLIDSLQSMNKSGRLNIVLINDQNEDSIAAIRNKYSKMRFRFVKGDFTRETILERANLAKAKTAIIVPSDGVVAGGHPDEKTIFATLTIKTMAPSVKVVAYITERDNLTHIRRANADEVIVSDEFGAYMVASHVADPGVPQTMELLMDAHRPGTLRRVSIPEEFAGETYDKLFDHFRSKKWVLISVFSEDEQIGIGEILSSDSSALDAFIERKLKEAGHSLGEENKTAVVINPKDDYIIKENEKAIVIQ
ncbi:MAG: ion channel [Candidatus Neomarinimicrobiota bacterium]|nr:ion channel [Candidatus Neomarinimicrobiota bacterium]